MKEINSGILIDFTIGGLAAAIAKTIIAPLERVKLLLQSRPGYYKGLINCFVRVYKDQGFLSYWRGNLPNILRYFPTQAMNFACKDYFNRTFNPYNHIKNPWKFFFGNMLSGGFAGASSLIFFYPLEFARTRLAADLGKKGKREFSGMVECIRNIYKSDGIVGLYRGFGISVFGIFIYRAFYFGIYDTGKFIFFHGHETNMFVMMLYAQMITVSASTMYYPMDTVRRQMMMQSGLKEKEFTTAMGSMRFIYKKYGVAGFYKGCMANIFRSTGGAMVLVFYDKIKKVLGVIPHKVSS